MKAFNKAVELLRKDNLRNVNILNFIENNTVHNIEVIGGSVLLKGRSDRDWVYISSTNDDDVKTIQSKLSQNDKCFGAIEDWMMPVLTKNKELVWKLSVVQYFLPDDVILPEQEIDTRPLVADDAATVYNNSEYKDFLSIEYVEERIQHGTNTGIDVNGNLAAWAITQDDGAIGFLHVLNDYRKKRLGYNVTLSLIKKLRKKNKLPFAYIEVDNRRSINLVNKLGFRKDKKVHWFEVK